MIEPAMDLAEAEDEDEPASAGRGDRNPPELERVASEVVSTLLDKMEVLSAVEVSDRGGQLDPESGEVSPLVLNVVGDDLGALIGRRGETLRDLQFIVRLIVSRKLGVWPNVVVDVEGYREKRTVALQALATRMADQVRRTRQAATLEPMPAHERRIVHLALRDDPDVYTESTGQDDSRKVQILPK
jgi:spoIIIJ-associated protein